MTAPPCLNDELSEMRVEAVISDGDAAAAKTLHLLV